MRHLRYTLLALMLLLGGNLLAQRSPFRQGLWVGAKAGGQATRFLFVPSVLQHTHLSQQGALALRYDVERSASLQLEVNYTRMGWKSRFDEESMHYQRNLDYVELPLLAHLYTGVGRFRLFLNAGPIVGYNIGDGVVQSDNLGDLPYAMPIANKLYWAVGGGPGVALSLGRRHLLELEGRFVYGYGNIWPSSRADVYSQSSSMRFAFSLNYFFRFANL